MEIDEISIENFRSHQSTGPVSIDDKLILVGENNAGKSNFIDALRLFFSSSSKPHSLDDFFDRNTAANIEISAWFRNLSDEETETFSEYMVNERLWVKAAFPYDEEAESVATKDFYVRKSVLTDENLRNIKNKPADECIRLYEEEYEAILEPYTSEVNWTGVNGASVKRVVDEYTSSGEAETKRAEISPRGLQSDLHQYSPTIDIFESTRNLTDATKTNSNALLGNLLNSALNDASIEKRDNIEDALNEIKMNLNEQDRFETIEKLESDLKSQLSSQIGGINDLNIKIDVPDLSDILKRATISVDDGFESNISMMGTGFHMSFILTLLLETVQRDTGTMTLCLEEPENNLHPHAQRKLYQTLDTLSDQGFQVFLTTHSPNLVRSKDLDSIVRVHHEENRSEVYRLDSDILGSDDLQKIETHLTPEENELFFGRTVLFCEGPSEREVLPILGELLDQNENNVYSMDTLGISVVSVGGKQNFEKFVKLSNSFGISSTLLVDNDSDRDTDHVSLIESLENQADNVVELSGDLENGLLKAASNQVFCDVLSDLSDSEIALVDLEAAINNDPHRTRCEIMRSLFNETNCSKPAFDRALADQFAGDELPSNIEDAIVQAIALAR